MGLKDVRVLAYVRRGPDVELMIEQVTGVLSCPLCGQRAQVKERPVVHYVDLPVYGTPMSLAWKKHRLRCVDPACPKRSWVLEDHRIAAKSCLLTTRAAKWATVQVGGGRTVSEVAAELACDWHTVNEAVITYGEALLGRRSQALEPHQRHRARRDLLRQALESEPHRLRHHGGRRGEPPDHRDPPDPQIHRCGGLDRQTAQALEGAHPLWGPRHVGHLCRRLQRHVAQGAQVVDPFHVISLANRSPRRRAPTGANRTDRAPGPT